mmetsp:Transcript_52164/g.121323  ORF Transcript_52164/g.121323 Transcript_52164/m.121323 type:complete len:342 (-) Transcript_52164:16-1041(-)
MGREEEGGSQRKDRKGQVRRGRGGRTNGIGRAPSRTPAKSSRSPSLLAALALDGRRLRRCRDQSSGRGEVGPHTVHEQHRLVLVRNGFVHERAVPVTVDVRLQPLQRLAPTHLAHLPAAKHPVAEAVKCVPEPWHFNGACEVDEGIAKTCPGLEVQWEVNKVVLPCEALAIEHAQKHLAVVVQWQVAQDDGRAPLPLRTEPRPPRCVHVPLRWGHTATLGACVLGLITGGRLAALPGCPGSGAVLGLGGLPGRGFVCLAATEGGLAARLACHCIESCRDQHARWQRPQAAVPAQAQPRALVIGKVQEGVPHTNCHGRAERSDLVGVRRMRWTCDKILRADA